MRLKNKTAIITGGTSGIGRATALRFAEEGADLVVTGRRVSLGKTVEAECRSKGVRCAFVEADHSKGEDCLRVVEAALKEFNRIDILWLFGIKWGWGRTQPECANGSGQS